MSNVTVKPKGLQGEFTPPADKSISHRAIIISSLTKGLTRIKNLSVCEDCLRTSQALQGLGISITTDQEYYYVHGQGLDGLTSPESEIYLGNSGTSMRLILGVLSGQGFSCSLSGDASLSQRPMKRVILPLSLMGAKIQARESNSEQYAPLTVRGGKLKPINYETPVASAQVKSAILLAGLYAQGLTKVTEPAKSRDHTERMLKKFAVSVSVQGRCVSVRGKANLVSSELEIPADFSSASFLLTGACIAKDSKVIVRSVGLNPTRIALLQVLRQMQADISWSYSEHDASGDDYGNEPKGEITAQSSHLCSINIGPERIPALIDELPILIVAATQAEGRTVIRDAGELRVKETDRISALVSNLAKMGADIRSEYDDITIHGPTKLKGASVDSFNDHRIAMSMAIAGLVADGNTTINNADCVSVSFPNFFEILSRL